MLSVERGVGGRLVRRTRRGRDVTGRLLDLAALAAVAVLVTLGTVNLRAVRAPLLAEHQLQSVVVGTALMLVLWATPPRWLFRLGWVVYGLAIVLLVAVAVAGVEAYGAKRWLVVGSTTIQPSELAKVGVLLVLADVLGSDRPFGRRMLLGVALAGVPVALTLAQPDLSTASLILVVTVLLLVLARLPLLMLMPLLVGALIAAPLAISFLKPYQLERVHGFLAGTPSPTTGAGWAAEQARLAMSAGGLFGIRGEPMHDVVALYLPNRDTDLALASLVEQAGLVAGALAVLAGLVLVWRLALAARMSRTLRGSLVGAGVAALVGTEIAVSLAGNLDLMPLAGVPFPFLSYGGSVAVAHLGVLGIVLAMRRDSARRRIAAVALRPQPKARLVRTTALATTAVLALLASYGWREHGASDPALRQAAFDQTLRCVAVPAARGTITDRHGTVLAGDSGRVTVQAFPGLLLAHPAHLRQTARLLGQPVATLAHRLRAAGTTLSIRLGQVPSATGARIDALRLTEVWTAPVPQRAYPYGPLVAPLLGFVGAATPDDVARWPNLPANAMVGRVGLERQYDAVLRGVEGRRCVHVTPAGTVVAPAPTRPAVPGQTVRLALDLPLQRQLTAALATALKGGYQQPRGDVGAAVAMDPRSGEVLAMASLPSYDNQVFGPPINVRAYTALTTAKGHPMLEKATQLVAPPGSTFKLVAAAASMVHPWIPPTKVIPTGGSWTYGGHTFGNWMTLGPMNLMESIAWSNDVYFYKLANAIGPDAIHDVGTKLGVGQASGIDLPGESAGTFGTPGSVTAAGGTWYGGSTVIMGIGQGYIATTPLQDARWTAAIASGRLVTPRLAMGFGGGPGSSYVALPPSPSVPLSFSSRLGPVREGMRLAATSGTAALLSNLPVAAGGKTGSSEDPASPNGKPDSWFTAAAPLKSPEIVVTAFVRGGGHGAPTTGPVVDSTMLYYFAHKAQVRATAR